MASDSQYSLLRASSQKIFYIQAKMASKLIFILLVVVGVAHCQMSKGTPSPKVRELMKILGRDRMDLFVMGLQLAELSCGDQRVEKCAEDYDDNNQLFECLVSIF